jgi:hypothetical protein
MSQYVEMLDGGYEPEKDYIYDIFTNFWLYSEIDNSDPNIPIIETNWNTYN